MSRFGRAYDYTEEKSDDPMDDVESFGIYRMGSGSTKLSSVFGMSSREKNALRSQALAYVGVTGKARTEYTTIKKITSADSSWNLANVRKLLGDVVTVPSTKRNWRGCPPNSPLQILMPLYKLDDYVTDLSEHTINVITAVAQSMLENQESHANIYKFAPNFNGLTMERAVAAVIAEFNAGFVDFEVYMASHGENNPELPTVRLCPSFKPRYKLVLPWTVPVTTLSSTYYDSVPRGKELQVSAVKSVNLTLDTYLLTNGCFVGQIHRLKNVSDVAKVLRATYPPESRVSGYDFGAMSNGLGVHIGDYQFYNTLNQWYNYLVIDPDVEGASNLESVTIEKTASAGIIWNEGVKRKSTIISDIDYANRMIQALRKIETGEDAEENADQYQTLRNFLLSQSQVQIKPKFEIMKIANLYTKVRNIFVFSSCWQMHVALFMSKVKEVISQPLQGDGGSLLGFMPMYGGIQVLVDTMMTRAVNDKQGVSGAFYSDNCYFVTWRNEVPMWYSCDVEKMECTSTVHEANKVMEYLCDLVGLPSSYLRKYIVLMGGEFCHDCDGVLNDYIIPVPGLSSGSQTTLIINHLRMSNAFSKLIRFFRASDQNKAILEAADDGAKLDIPTTLGVYFNLEKTVSSSGYTAVTALNTDDLSPPRVSLHQYMRCLLEPSIVETECVGTLQQFGGILTLDMLGFNATMVRITRDDKLDSDFEPDDPHMKVILCACLDYERVMKALCFRKTKEQRKDMSIAFDPSTTDFVVRVIHLMTLQTLFMVGGYAYPTASELIRGCAKNIAANIFESYKTLLATATSHNNDPDHVMQMVKDILVKEAINFLTGGDLEIIVPESTAIQMAELAGGIMDKIIDNNNSWHEYFERERVITRFHTQTGKAEAIALSRSKIDRLQLRKGTMTKAKRARTVDEDRKGKNRRIEGGF